MHLTEIENAYDPGNSVTPKKEVQKAMLYENFLASQNLFADCDMELLDDLDLDSPAPGHIDSGPPKLSDCIHHPPSQDGPLVIQRISKASDFVVYGADSRLVKFLGAKNISAAQRVRRFRPVLRRYLSNSHLLWLFEHSDLAYKDPRHLMQQLGLYGRHGIQAGESVLLLTIRINRLRKPDWVDAEMAYYFDPAPDVQNHGWTRCLRTGHQCRREWVCVPNEFLSLVDVIPLQSICDIFTLEPEKGFWEYHRQRIFGEVHG